MSSLLVEGRTLAEVEQDREADEVPASWTRWARCRDGVWTMHERREAPLQPVGRRLRGSQDYGSLHLGRGTKWIKTRDKT